MKLLWLNATLVCLALVLAACGDDDAGEGEQLVGAVCGDVTCATDEYCCDAACGLCVEMDVACNMTCE